MSLRIRSAVARSTRDVVALWPLSSFIAVNPMGGDEHRDFDTTAPTRDPSAFFADYRSGRITHDDLVCAVTDRIPELAGMDSGALPAGTLSAAEVVIAELLGDTVVQPEGTSLRPDRVDEISTKWVMAYLDPEPLWSMPNKAAGIWGAWRMMAPHDPDLPSRARKRVADLPESADEALEMALTRLGVSGDQIDGVLRREAAGTPGWTAHIKWRADHRADIDLTSFLAIRLSLRWALQLPLRSAPPGVAPGMVSVADRAERVLSQLGAGSSSAVASVRARIVHILAMHPVEDHAATWQQAYEHNYRTRLVDVLDSTGAPSAAPVVQVVMCIDPRSEGMRRRLEADAGIETFGFAGFFGVPIRFARYGARGSIDALPALLSPKHSVTEHPTKPRQAARYVRALQVKDAARQAWHASENSPIAPFAMAETMGWFSGLATLARTLWPAVVARSSAWVQRRTTPEIPTTVTVSDAFSLDERAALAENAIRMMGLTRVADLVILSGHGSTSTNNLYQSALDCGACGGNPGAANARAAAALFNDPEVRGILGARGLLIPESSYFVAAEHNTVSDLMTVLDAELVPASHREQVDEFLAFQAKVADELIIERAENLPGAAGATPSALRARAYDWAEVYPEMGLVGNAALVIAPRDISRGADLERRVFLHSYSPQLDPDGSALETIMTAPLVVAQWINHQYYFSSVDQDRWGAGTKTIHNAIGTLGVISGQAGDLRRGLPLQSIAVGDELLHEPLRLSVFIQAPLDRIGAIVSRNQVLRSLIDNNWITLTAREDENEAWHRHGTYGWKIMRHPLGNGE